MKNWVEHAATLVPLGVNNLPALDGTSNNITLLGAGSGEMEALGGEVPGPAWQQGPVGGRVSPTAEVRL